MITNKSQPKLIRPLIDTDSPGMLTKLLIIIFAIQTFVMVISTYTDDFSMSMWVSWGLNLIILLPYIHSRWIRSRVFDGYSQREKDQIGGFIIFCLLLVYLSVIMTM